MYRLLGCLTTQHDVRLTILAAMVCVLACGLGFWLAGSIHAASGRRRRSMILLAGASIAVGIWSTHFIAVLAYDAGLPINFDVTLTMASLLITLVATVGGFALTTVPMRGSAFVAGGLIGLGISAMHFTGMHGVTVAANVTWDQSMVATAVSSGVLLSILAVHVHLGWTGRARFYGASALLISAICATHFIAMAAVTFVPDVTVTVSQTNVQPLALGLLVAVITVVLLLIGVCTALYDSLTIERSVTAIGSAIMVTLTTMIVIGLYTIDQVRIGGPNFQRIAASKDLVADVLPPPAFIVESYLEARILASDPDKLAYHARRLQTMRRDYEARHAHWQTSTLIPDETRRLLTITSDAHVRQFWAEVDWSFLPAVARFDATEIQDSLKRLSVYYLAHRTVIEGLVKQADAQSDEITSTLSQRASTLERLVLGAATLLMIAVMAAIWGLRAMVVQPVLRTASYLDDLRSGRYDMAAPFKGRHDEIGQMAQAIDTLRLDAVEKQRLEREATETRRTREKERAAEALRLRMANEHITGLNDRVTQAFSQLERAQEDNLRKGRLAQLGQLTATVAHEIRNPLGAIKTAAYLIERKTKGKDLGIEAPMQRVSNGIQRCDAIITELLDFTRAKALAASPQAVDTWVASIVAEERRNVPKQVEIDLRPGIGADIALFDASRMRRVLVNLISNASEAMVGKPGQPIEHPTIAPQITIATRVIGDSIEIIVADNGPGIAPADLERIREPLFTTKSFGVGLGVPAVENILEQHGGGLRIVSALGEGAVFTAWFPRRSASEAERDGDAPADASALMSA